MHIKSNVHSWLINGSSAIIVVVIIIIIIVIIIVLPSLSHQFKQMFFKTEVWVTASLLRFPRLF